LIWASKPWILSGRELPCRELPYAIESNTGVWKCASVHDAALLLCGHRRLSLILSKQTTVIKSDRSTGSSGE